MTSIISTSSGVSLVGDISQYQNINQYTPYENNVIMLINLYEKWDKMIELKLLSQGECNFGYSILQ